MNETQKNFIDLLKEYPNGVTLLELKLEKGIDKARGTAHNSSHQPNTAKDDEKKSKRVLGSQRFSGC